MATEFTPDGMAAKLASLYPLLGDSVSDRYAAWWADNGPDYDSIVNFIETQTSLPFSDGWNIYWTGAAFDPASINNLAGWWKADGTLYQDSGRTTVATVDGDVVGSWTDESGNGRHLNQATAASRPVLKLGANGINGLPVVKADGVDDYLSTAATVTSTNNQTMFLVFRPVGTGTNNGRELTSNANEWLMGARAGTYRVYNNTNFVDDGAVVADTPVLLTGRTDSSIPETRLFKNGVSQATHASAGGAISGVRLFARFTGDEQSNSAIAEVLVYGRALTDGERQEVEQYLIDKYGIV